MFHQLSQRGDVHGIHYWTFSTYADRDAHLPSEGPSRLPNSTDVSQKRVCLVAEDFSFHALFGYSPVVWKPIGGGSDRLQLDVPPTVDVLDLVYITGSMTGDKADNFTGGYPVAGAVVAKIGSGVAIVYSAGIVSGYSGLTPGSKLFLGTAGAIISPPLPTTPGTIIQSVGKALSSSVILLEIDQPILL